MDEIQRPTPVLMPPTTPTPVPTSGPVSKETHRFPALMIGILVAVLVIAGIVYFLLQKPEVYKGEDAAPTTADVPQASVSESTQTIAAPEQIEAAPETESTDSFAAQCQEHAGDFDAVSGTCSVITVGVFTSYDEFKKALDEYTACTADSTKTWEEATKSCREVTPETSLLKGSASELAFHETTIIEVPDDDPVMVSPEPMGELPIPQPEQKPDQEVAPEPLPEVAAVPEVVAVPEIAAVQEVVPTPEPAKPSAFSDNSPTAQKTKLAAHGVYIQGDTGPGILLYPVAIALAHGAAFALRKKKK